MAGIYPLGNRVRIKIRRALWAIIYEFMIARLSRVGLKCSSIQIQELLEPRFGWRRKIPFLFVTVEGDPGRVERLVREDEAAALGGGKAGPSTKAR